MSNDLIVRPLGGVGEIGSNCTLFESQNTRIFVDYGILFPYEDFFSISYLAASLDQVEDSHKETILFITHGHEDHIGAVFHFIEKFPNIRILTPKFASMLIRKKLSERGIAARLEVYNSDFKLDFDNLTLHPIAVTHSIPDTYGLIISEKSFSYSILFISDFKFDLNPLYELPFDWKKIERIFKSSKFNYALMDSTNILNNGKTLSERDLVDDFRTLLSRDKRIFIPLFSSNIFRIRTINEVAKENGKKIVLLGRSIKSYVQAAIDCGHLDPDNIIIDEKSLKSFSKNYIYLLTGCQGDFFGALRRVSDNEFKNITISEDDLFLFSSKAIPGNEKKINRIYNSLTEKGASILTSKDFKIHASGHPSKEDLAQLYEKISPDLIVPIHGESYFLEKHKEFAVSLGLSSKIFLNNSVLKVSSESHKFIPFDPIPPIIYHSKDLVLERESISKRRKLATLGVCFIAINKHNRNISYHSLGLPQWFVQKEEQIKKLIKGQLSKKLMQKNDDEITETIRIFTRNLVNNYLFYKPVCVVSLC